MQCSDERVSRDELRVLRETAVVRVVPITFHVGADVRSEGSVRVGGVKLLVRAPDGVPADEMTRVLQCHSAKALLGQVALPAEVDDPYTLPEAWVDIDVTSENGLFAVKVTADRVSENLTLLHHAALFAEVHR